MNWMAISYPIVLGVEKCRGSPRVLQLIRNDSAGHLQQVPDDSELCCIADEIKHGTVPDAGPN